MSPDPPNDRRNRRVPPHIFHRDRFRIRDFEDIDRRRHMSLDDLERLLFLDLDDVLRLRILEEIERRRQFERNNFRRR